MKVVVWLLCVGNVVSAICLVDIVYNLEVGKVRVSQAVVKWNAGGGETDKILDRLKPLQGK
jgi:hypothetical protein